MFFYLLLLLFLLLVLFLLLLSSTHGLSVHWDSLWASQEFIFVVPLPPHAHASSMKGPRAWTVWECWDVGSCGSGSWDVGL
jgi:hypothetical protein